MKRFITQMSLLAAVAIIATGCAPTRHNLPPEQHLMQPGPGVGGPGPGVMGPPPYNRNAPMGMQGMPMGVPMSATETSDIDSLAQADAGKENIGSGVVQVAVAAVPAVKLVAVSAEQLAEWSVEHAVSFTAL